MSWQNMKMMIVDDGARGELIASRIAASPCVREVILAPGGIRNCFSKIGKVRRVPIPVSDVDELVDLAKRQNIGLLFPTCDAPLVAGIIDRAEENGILAFGPSARLAAIEGSKAAGCYVAEQAGVPHPSYKVFTNLEQAKAYIRSQSAPYIVKTDGLDRGKGVSVCQNLAEAEQAIERRLATGGKIVIQEFLQGPELSLHVLSNGKHWWAFPPMRDHKHFDPETKRRVTGGIFTYAPVPGINFGLGKQMEYEIVTRLFDYWQRQGLVYKGILYPGLKLHASGPKVLEWNVRFGNPEMVVLRLFSGDFFVVLYRAARGENIGPWTWDQRFAACLVLCVKGYPESDEGLGEQISGISEANKISGVEVVPGAVEERNGKWFTAGGRVLYVTALGNTLDDAIAAAYAAAARIDFAGKQFLPESKIDK